MSLLLALTAAADAAASGALASVALSAPTGTASAGANADAAGTIASIALTAAAAIASGDATASGAFAGITFLSPSGFASAPNDSIGDTIGTYGGIDLADDDEAELLNDDAEVFEILNALFVLEVFA